MYKISQATYKDSSLILAEKLNPKMEGKILKVIIINDEIDSKKERFWEMVDRHTFTLPKDYKFNQEDLYDR